MGPFEYATIYGDDDSGGRSPYLTRASIGRLRLHVFCRGDNDPDPHDHRAGFWTFPLRGYREDVWQFDPLEHKWLWDTNYVKPFRLHRRPATYLHRVIERSDGRKIITISWWQRPRREWGFRKVWDAKQCWVPWRDYVFGSSKQDKCP